MIYVIVPLLGFMLVGLCIIRSEQKVTRCPSCGWDMTIDSPTKTSPGRRSCMTCGRDYIPGMSPEERDFNQAGHEGAIDYLKGD